MLETLGEDYVLTARAKGLANWEIIWKHGLRNAMLPLVTLLALSVRLHRRRGDRRRGCLLLPGHRPGHHRRHRPPRLRGAPGHLPRADNRGHLLQLRGRPSLLQARPAGDHVSSGPPDQIVPFERGECRCRPGRAGRDRRRPAQPDPHRPAREPGGHDRHDHPGRHDADRHLRRRAGAAQPDRPDRAGVRAAVQQVVARSGRRRRRHAEPDDLRRPHLDDRRFRGRARWR